MTNGPGGPGTGGLSPGVTGVSKQHPAPSNLATWLTGIPGEGALAAIAGAALGTLLAGAGILSIEHWRDVFFAFFYIMLIGAAGYLVHLIGITALLGNWKALVFGIVGFVISEVALFGIAAARSEDEPGLRLQPDMAVVPIILLAWLSLTVLIVIFIWLFARRRSHG